MFLEGRSFSCAVQVFYFRRPEATSVAEGFVFWGFFSSLFSRAASRLSLIYHEDFSPRGSFTIDFFSSVFQPRHKTPFWDVL